MQTDGKLVAVGRAVAANRSNFALVRYNSDGSADSGFGQGGQVITSPGTDGYAFAAAIQGDGKIVAAGYATAGIRNATLIRYLSDGSLDPDFGSGGIASTQVTGSASLAFAVAIQTDRKIVVAGHPDGDGPGDIILIRYDSDGVPDPSFGHEGVVIADLGSDDDEALAIAIQPDSRIVVAGLVRDQMTREDFAVARFNQDGSPDLDFGDGGKTSTALSPQADEALAVVLQPDGKIILGGFTTPTGLFDLALVRYTADGHLDSTFGNGGVAGRSITSDTDLIESLTLQADGKIIAGGGVNNDEFALVRFIGDTCGDGVRDPGEDCDDGNLVDGDCCSSTCQFEENGSPCPDDGERCTDDRCNDVGACVHPARTDRCELGDCDPDGAIDIFDVLHKIRIIIHRATPTPTEAVFCDDDCDGDIDVFDVLREIDAILGRIPRPLTCLEQQAPQSPIVARRQAPRVVLGALGRTVTLASRGRTVRALELTLVPEGGPVDVVGARATRRTRGFLVAAHQANPTAPVKVVVVSLAGAAIAPGNGTIARLELTGASRQGRLRLTNVRVAE